MFQFLTKILESSSTAGRNTAKRSPKSFRSCLAIECLEDRWCPTVNFNLGAGLLTVTGTNLANQVSLRENTTNHTLEVRTLNGETMRVSGMNTPLIPDGAQLAQGFGFNRDSIGGIKVDLQGGDDQFIYELRGAAGATNFLKAIVMNVNLGEGVNTARINLRDSDPTQPGVNPITIKAGLNVTVTGGSQHDDVGFQLGAVEQAGVEITTHLGGGNDVATVDLWGSLTHSLLHVNLDGGGGDDNLIFSDDGTDVNGQRTVIDANSILKVEAHGDGTPQPYLSPVITLQDKLAMARLLPGNDLITVSCKATLEGALTIAAEGQDGKDTVQATVAAHSGQGSLDLSLKGGTGDDHLSFILTQQSIHILNAVLDGEEGFDVAHVTPTSISGLSQLSIEGTF